MGSEEGAVQQWAAPIRPASLVLNVTVEGEPEPLKVTPEHPFLVHRARNDLSSEESDPDSHPNGEWIEAGHLKVGDQLRTATGTWAEITDIKAGGSVEWAYNFEVAENHSYVVGGRGVVVHNIDSDCPEFSNLVTLDLTAEDQAWRRFRFQEGEEGGIYVLRDKNTHEPLKVGKTDLRKTGKTGEVEYPFLGRFDDYMIAGKLSNRDLLVDVFTMRRVTGKTLESIEKQMRELFIKQGYKLDWDNTLNRLDRSGPGTPGAPLKSKTGLRQNKMWLGEHLVDKLPPFHNADPKMTLRVKLFGKGSNYRPRR